MRRLRTEKRDLVRKSEKRIEGVRSTFEVDIKTLADRLYKLEQETILFVPETQSPGWIKQMATRSLTTISKEIADELEARVLESAGCRLNSVVH